MASKRKKYNKKKRKKREYIPRVHAERAWEYDKP